MVRKREKGKDATGKEEGMASRFGGLVLVFFSSCWVLGVTALSTSIPTPNGCVVPRTPYRPPLLEAAGSFKMVGSNTIGQGEATLYVRQVQSPCASCFVIPPELVSLLSDDAF